MSPRATDRVAEHLRDPLFWIEVVQHAKIVLAAVVAWVVATDVLGLPNAVLAPWAAVLVVHATVYRTFTRGAQQVSATVLAVVMAWAVGQVLGTSPLTLGVALALAFVVGRLTWLRDESTTLATTTIVVLGTGYLDGHDLLFGRLADTGVGIAVGLLVNLLVWPPMRDRAAAAFVTDIAHDVGEVLSDIADGLGPDLGEDDTVAWLKTCRRIDVRHDEAWGLVRQARESVRLNPRQRARRARVADLEDVLHGLEQGVAEVQSMVRTVGVSARREHAWDDGFRGRWADLLRATAQAISDDDADGLDRVLADLAALADDLSTEELRAGHWPEYGALLVNLRNIVTSMHPVAQWHDRRRPIETQARAAARAARL